MTAENASPLMTLNLHDIRLFARLGCTADERAVPQPVRIELSIFFAELPEAMHRDEAEFICYDKLTSILREVVEKGEYRLIEFLAGECFRAIGQQLEPGMQLWLKLTKCEPPVPEIHGGASVVCSDVPVQPATSW